MKLYKSLFLLIAVSLFVSCELDYYPHSSVSPDSITESDLPALRMGMYNRAQNNPTTRAYIMFDILGGDLTSGSLKPKDLINNTLSPLNSYIVSNWNGQFAALYHINNVLSAAERFQDSPSANLTKGEAHYFRAYAYLNLVTRWGDVPILKKNTNEKVSRDPESEVWAFIESELESAITLLGDSNSYYYVSKDAALALKARVMLYEGKMAEAADIAEELIRKYKLDSFDKIFRKTANSEVIFAFENRSEESSINISDLFYTYGHPNKGQGVYNVTQDAESLFSEDDTRRNITLIDIAGEMCINKYPSGQTGRDPFIVSRAAEMYLISAEAQGRAVGTSRLNDLREFRGLDPISVSSDAEFIEAIITERRRELLGENHLFYDYVRTGLAVSKLGILEYQTLLPIPGKELQLNTNLKPNPGY